MIRHRSALAVAAAFLRPRPPSDRVGARAEVPRRQQPGESIPDHEALGDVACHSGHGVDHAAGAGIFRRAPPGADTAWNNGAVTGSDLALGCMSVSGRGTMASTVLSQPQRRSVMSDRAIGAFRDGRDHDPAGRVGVRRGFWHVDTVAVVGDVDGVRPLMVNGRTALPSAVLLQMARAAAGCAGWWASTRSTRPRRGWPGSSRRRRSSHPRRHDVPRRTRRPGSRRRGGGAAVGCRGGPEAAGARARRPGSW